MLPIFPNTGWWSPLGGVAIATTLLLPSQAALVESWRFEPTTQQLEVILPVGVTPRYLVFAEPARIVLAVPDTETAPQPPSRYDGQVSSVSIERPSPEVVHIVLELAPGTRLDPRHAQLSSAPVGDQVRWTLTPLLASGTLAQAAPPSQAPTPAAPAVPTVPAVPSAAVPEAVPAAPADALPPPEPAASPQPPAAVASQPAPAVTLPADPTLTSGQDVSTRAANLMLPTIGDTLPQVLPIDPFSLGFESSEQVSVPDLEDTVALAEQPTVSEPAAAVASGVIEAAPPDRFSALAPEAPPAPAAPTSATPAAPEAVAAAPTAITAPPPTATAAPAEPPPAAAETALPATPSAAIDAPPPTAAAAAAPAVPAAPAVQESAGIITSPPPAVATVPTPPPATNIQITPPPPAAEPVMLAATEPIAFGQPLPQLAAVRELPNTPENAAIPQPTDVFLARNTLLELRYVGAAMEVPQSEAQPATLVLANDLRDAADRLVAPAGSQLQGRFEPTETGPRWVSEALIMNGRQVALRGTSDYLAAAPEVNAGNLALYSGAGALALTVLTGFTGFGLLGGAVLGATTAVGTAPQTITLQPNDIIEVRVLENVTYAALDWTTAQD